jgi:PAS domain S-box-containing protein
MGPLGSVLRILLVIAVVEFLLMLGLGQFELLDGIAGALLDAAVTAAIAAPFLYVWVVEGVAEQATEEMAARMSKLKFRELLDAVAEGAVLVDRDGRIRHINRQAEQLFGFERTELVNQPIELLVPERLRKAHVGHRDRYMADPQLIPQGIGRELVGRRRDGSEFPMELSLSPMETDGEFGVLALVTDISGRRKT